MRFGYLCIVGHVVALGIAIVANQRFRDVRDIDAAQIRVRCGRVPFGWNLKKSRKIGGKSASNSLYVNRHTILGTLVRSRIFITFSFKRI